VILLGRWLRLAPGLIEFVLDGFFRQLLAGLVRRGLIKSIAHIFVGFEPKIVEEKIGNGKGENQANNSGDEDWPAQAKPQAQEHCAEYAQTKNCIFQKLHNFKSTDEAVSRIITRMESWSASLYSQQ